MSPPDQPATVAQQVNALVERFARLGQRLADNAAELANGGAPPSVELIDELDAARSEFADARRSVLDTARDVELAEIPPGDKLGTLSALQELMRAALLASERRAAQAAKQRALDVLRRVQALVHRDDPAFSALVECQATAARLHEILLPVDWPASHDELTPLAEGRHPLAQLLEFVERQHELDDATWSRLEDTLAAALGRPLIVAAARGRLESRPGRPEARPDSPAQTGWGDEWPTMTIDRSPAPSGAGPLLPPVAAEDHVPAIQRLIWQALAQDRDGAAGHLAAHLDQCHQGASPRLPSCLIRAVALGRHVRHGNGDIAACLADDFAQLAASMDVSVDASVSGTSRAIWLLVAASALRPALVAPNTGAPGVLRALPADEAVGVLHRYCQLVGAYAEGHPPLGPHTLQGTPAPEAWRDAVEDLMREIAAWRVRVLGLRTTFPPATDVWQGWLRPDGLIHALLLPLTVDPWGLAVARELVERLSNDQRIQGEIGDTDRRVLGRTVGPDIAVQPAAFHELRGRVREAVGFARRWIALQERRPGRPEDEAERLGRALREQLGELRAGVAAELASMAGATAPLPLRAAGAQLRATLRSLDALLWEEQSVSQASSAGEHEALPARILHVDLLRVPGCPLDPDWQPVQTDDESLASNLAALIAPNVDPDWRRLFDEALAAGDHRATGLIIEQLATSGGTGLDLAELRSLRDDDLRRCRQTLAHDVDCTREAIDRGQLQEREAAQLLAVPQRVALALPAIVRFGPWHARLAAVRDRVDQAALAGPAAADDEPAYSPDDAALLDAARLDPRYGVIAYVLALAFYSPPDDSASEGFVGEGVSAAWLRERVIGWCGEPVRQDCSDDAFGELLEQMVDRGVLLRTGPDQFGLRCASVLPRIGTEDELMSRLFELARVTNFSGRPALSR